MLSDIPLLILLLLAPSIYCMPFLNKNFISEATTSIIGSCPSIQLDFDLRQGMQPNLRQMSKSFGYVHRLDTPNLEIGSDIDISLQHKSASVVPMSQAAMVLSRLSFSNDQFTIQGRISQLSAQRFNRVSTEGTEMRLQLSAFAADYDDHWYKKFHSTGISGRVSHVEVKKEQVGNKVYDGLTIILTPSYDTDKEFLYYTTAADAKVKRIDWNYCSKRGNILRNRFRSDLKNKLINNDKRDKFYELVDSAVLL